MEYFLEKIDSQDSDLTIHIPTMRPIHLHETYKQLHNLIFINFVIFIMSSTLKLMLGVVDKNSLLEIIMKDSIVVLDDLIFFVMFYFLSFVLYLLNKEYEPETKRVSNNDIVDLEEKEEEDEEENDEEEDEKDNEFENKNSDDFEEEEDKETEETERKNVSYETDKININKEQNVEMIDVKNKKKKKPKLNKNFEKEEIDIFN